MGARSRVGRARPSMAVPVRRAILVGLVGLVVTLASGSSAQAGVTIPGGLGGEILTNPVPVPGPAPNVLPLPPPPPREPGFGPAPGGPERQIQPVPEPRVGVHDGPGSGPPAAPPVHVDADAAEPGAADDHEPVGTLSLDPDEVRFSQNSVNEAAEVEAGMRADGWVGEPIDVVRMPDGGLTTIDNTRLLAAKRAGIRVRVYVHNLKEAIPQRRADELRPRKGPAPKTWGEAVMNRIGRQNAAYRSAYPLGSPVTGWTGN